MESVLLAIARKTKKTNKKEWDAVSGRRRHDVPCVPMPAGLRFQAMQCRGNFYWILAGAATAFALCLLAVKSIFHYSWQWQLVLLRRSTPSTASSPIWVIRPWPWPAIHDMSEKASEIRGPDGQICREETGEGGKEGRCQV